MFWDFIVVMGSLLLHLVNEKHKTFLFLFYIKDFSYWHTVQGKKKYPLCKELPLEEQCKLSLHVTKSNQKLNLPTN